MFADYLLPPGRAADAAIDIGNMGSRGPPDIGGLISLKVDNFPFDMTCARPQHRVAPRHPRPTDRCRWRPPEAAALVHTPQ